MGASTPEGDFAGVLDLQFTVQHFCIFSHPIEQFLKQIRKRHDFTQTKVHQPAVNPVTLGAPAVLLNEARRVDTPALIACPQPVKYT